MKLAKSLHLGYVVLGEEYMQIQYKSNKKTQCIGLENNHGVLTHTKMGVGVSLFRSKIFLEICGIHDVYLISLCNDLYFILVPRFIGC